MNACIHTRESLSHALHLQTKDAPCACALSIMRNMPSLNSACMHPTHPLDLYVTVAPSLLSLMCLTCQLQKLYTWIKARISVEPVVAEGEHL